MPRLTALGPGNASSTSRALLSGITDRHGDAGPDGADDGPLPRVLADVVGLVALNQLTGAFNLVAGLEPITRSS
jgi:hypothetical protein